MTGSARTRTVMPSTRASSSAAGRTPPASSSCCAIWPRRCRPACRSRRWKTPEPSRAPLTLGPPVIHPRRQARGPAMNLFDDIRTAVIDALGAMMRDGALPDGLSLDAVAVEPPRDPAHGDMATNAAMVLAKPAGRKPRDIAATLADLLPEDDRVAVAEVAGPGFLILRLAPALWQGVLRNVLETGLDFGRSDFGQGKRVNVEYVSANPTG